MRVLVACLFAGAVLANARVCRAQATSSEVSFAIDACVALDAELVERVARLELGTAAGARETASTRISVGCEASLVLLHIEDNVTGKTLERRIDLASEPAGARARVLGLAIAESVHASWVELTLQNATPETYVDANASAERRMETRERIADVSRLTVALPRFHVSVGATLIAFSGSYLSLFGWEFDSRFDVARKLALELDCSLVGATDRSLGRSVSVQAALCRPSVRLFDRFGRYELSLVAGLMLGGASMTPEFVAGDHFTQTAKAFFWGARAGASARVYIGWGASVGAGLEVGWNAHELEGRVQGSALSTGHLWLGAQTALIVSF